MAVHGARRLALKSIANSEKVDLDASRSWPERTASGPPARARGARAARPTRRWPARCRLLVLDGRLPLRTRLPGERELAEALGVSRTTATAAYAALREEGFLASRRGAGSWTRLPADPGVAPAPAGAGGRRTSSTSAAPRCAAPEGALHARARRAPPPSSRATCPGPGYDAAGLPVAARGDRRAPHRARRRRPRPSRCSSPRARSTR